MNAPAIISVSHLPSLIDRAASALTAARSSAEVLEARDMAGFAYDAAKRAARLEKAKNAHDDVVAAAFRAQADALEIEAQAKRRIADEYDAAQERGEVASQGKPVNIPDGNVKARVGDLGFTAKAIHEARQIRNAEAVEPGVVRRALDQRLAQGREPNRTALRQAVVHVAQHGYRAPTPAPSTRRNPVYEPNPDFDRTARIAALCVSLVEKTEGLDLSEILAGCTGTGMRDRTLSDLRACLDRLADLLEDDHAAEA